MTKLAILEYPDPRLRKKAAPVAVVNDALRQLADNMLETMYTAKGVGLAATQVDVHKRLIVLDVSEEEADKILLTLDPLAAMAESDSERIKSLLATVQTNSEAVEELLRRTAGEQLWELVHPQDTVEPPAQIENCHAAT